MNNAANETNTNHDVLVPGLALAQLRHRIVEIQGMAYTYGESNKAAVSQALDSVLIQIDELNAKQPLPAKLKQAVVEPEEPESTADQSWRRLAMQFDGHRMQALHHLRAMTQDPAKHMEHALSFLSAGPLPGEVVLAQRIAAIARKGMAGQIFKALTDRGEAPLEELRCVLMQIKENSSEANIVDCTDDAIAWLDVAEAIRPGEVSEVQPSALLSADECFVALSWLDVARKRINMTAADDALLAKLGEICPSAARNVEQQSEVLAATAKAGVDVTDVLALIDYCDGWCRDIPQELIDKARVAYLAARANGFVVPAGGLSLAAIWEAIDGNPTHLPSDAQEVLDVLKILAQAADECDDNHGHQAAVSKQVVPADLVRDAQRWRAFVASARIKPQGSAGLSTPMEGNYAHMGLELWTTFDRDYSADLLARMDSDTARGRDWLTKYADVAVAARHAAADADGTLVCPTCWRFLNNPLDSLSENCGGHCLQCMADAEDPDAIAAVAALSKAS